MAKKEYDRAKMKPAIMSSIKNEKDLKKFIKMYGIDENEIVKMW